MGIRMIEPFDYLADADGESMSTPLADSRWVAGAFTTVANTTAATDETPDGRFGVQLGNSAALLYWLDNTGHQKWIVAHDCKFTFTAAATGPIFEVGYQGATGFAQLVRIDRTQLNSVQAYTGTELHGESGNNVITLTSPNFYELQAVIATATGSVELWVDADKVITATDVDTKGTTTATHINMWRAYGGAVNPTKVFSNMRIWDGSGTQFNEALGKVTHNTIVLVATNGTINDWTTTTTATNYELVDEQSKQDGDTTFLEAGTASQQQYVGMSAIPANRVEIHGLQTTAVVRRTAGGDADVKMMVLSNGVSATGGDNNVGGQRNLNSAYWWINEIWENDPDTGVAWVATAARDVEPGVKYATATA